jgi:beta-aspartyl-dipeptidase (metallo-type)
MFILIENGELYAPQSLGRQRILIVDDVIARIGRDLTAGLLESAGIEVDVIDASGCVVTPGFIDPHEHLLGGSGESGFSSQTPEISMTEIASAGITTVVGCLGVDTTMKTLPGLLAKAKGLKEEGLNSYIFSGGYNVPPTTITSSIRDDLLFIEEVIGAGEIAISDRRSSEPALAELARLVSDAQIGGMLARKSGITHFHVGPGEGRLSSLRQLVDSFDVEPAWLYPTHVTRSEALIKEAVDHSRSGGFVDMDTADENLPQSVRSYLDNGGDLNKLTVSSDASITGPHLLYEQIRACIECGFPLPDVLALVTANTADVLQLHNKGRLDVGKAADILVLRKETLEIIEVISLGRRLVKNGRVAVRENFLTDSNRRITLRGEKS